MALAALLLWHKTATGNQIPPTAPTVATSSLPMAVEATSTPLAYIQPAGCLYSPDAIKQAIQAKSEAAGLDPKTMVAIAKAESQFRNVPNYKYTTEKGKYTAYGPFQITRTTYKAFCGNPAERLDVEKNIDCAMKIATSSGLHHWDESAANW